MGLADVVIDSSKKTAKRVLAAVGMREATLDRYRRFRRVRAARAFLEGGFVFPEDRAAIVNDYADVCLHTQLSISGICNLEALARHMIARGFEGAFVECGTWRGGALGYWARSFV